MKKINDIFAYIVGYYRYAWYYDSALGWLIRIHIREQIDWRIEVMDEVCYTQGACVLCGCDTTALQMANKACGKPCYPRMMSKTKWNKFKDNGYE